MIHCGAAVQSQAVQSVRHHVFGPIGFDPAYLPIVRSISVMLVLWLMAFWMHRQKIFVRI